MLTRNHCAGSKVLTAEGDQEQKSRQEARKMTNVGEISSKAERDREREQMVLSTIVRRHEQQDRAE